MYKNGTNTEIEYYIGVNEMKLFILIFMSLGLLVSCGDSKYGAGNNPVDPKQVGDEVDPFDASDKPTGAKVTYHCSNVKPNEYASRKDKNYFVGNGTIGGGKGAYRDLMEIAGVCMENGQTQYTSANYYNSTQSYYSGTASCSYWDQNYELTLGFDPSNSKMAKIFIKSTGDGFPAGWVGQGFPTELMEFNGYIDCTKEDLTIHALAWNQNTGKYGYISVIVPNEYGHKNHYSMRASLYFEGSLIGTSKLDIQ